MCFTRVSQGEGLLTSTLSTAVLEFSLENERVASIQLWVTERKAQTVCAYAPKNSPGYPTFWECLVGVLERIPPRDL